MPRTTILLKLTGSYNHSMNGDGDSNLVPVSLCEQGANVPTSASDNELAKLPRIVVKSCLPRGKVMSFKFVASLTNNPACSNLHERRQSSASFFAENVTPLYASLPLWSKLE